MGWERKRGKLHELNRLLRGRRTRRSCRCLREAPPLPRTCATSSPWTKTPAFRARPRRRLIGAMAHPLNQPVFDLETGRVAAGYAVLQPRVTRPCRPPARARSSSRSSRGRGGPIPTPSPRPMFTRTSSAKAATPARASTTWTPSSTRSPAASRRTRCSPTTCSKVSSLARGCFPTSSSSRATRPTTRPPPCGRTDGCAETGSSFPGSSGGCRTPPGERSRTPFRASDAGR